MATIKPTITLTANKSTATSNPGPLSVSLSLSTTDLLSVDTVESKIHSFADATSHVRLFDGAALGGDTETAGTIGCFLYFKNIGTTGDVYIGVQADDDTAADIGAANQPDDFSASTRLFTLKPGEFAWMPYDYALDIVGDASAAATLEYWRFDRG
tara:strand:+ start:54 stop:518 length:465 start_codon:yes stop_codon:yes gene_type:complete